MRRSLVPLPSVQINFFFLWGKAIILRRYFVHYLVTSVTLSREPGYQIRGRSPVRLKNLRLSWGIYLGWDKRQVQCDPGQPAVGLPKLRTVWCLVTWVEGGAECQKIVKETPFSPEFPELYTDLSP